ncbi:MAG: protease HTPX [Candidatus Carbobacillus altaicus]|uniref:Protease HTPX n=1 Tax=Candidatus Carbonibacillus altaicus TaxID=2163959 RepID=A0A2R6Y3L7_9BACL|nr:MAG: protease HTPX [Candidatus Carbobacillus altaicus]
MFGASAYGAFLPLFDRDKKEKRKELNRKLQKAASVEIIQVKDGRRIAVDLLLTLLVCSGAVAFFLLAPDGYAITKLFIGIWLISVLGEMIERMGNFYSTRLFWLPDEEHLVILSLFQSRDFPLREVQEVRSESSPDLLKLHPLFTFLSPKLDFTGSFGEVLRLSFPGEEVYLTPEKGEDWKSVFASYGKDVNHQETKQILPPWHPAVIKRLFWKGYFAVTVKGISAYAGLLLLLVWLDVPTWATVLFILFWWAFNVYVSDRVLTAATDAEPLTGGEVYDRAQSILKKAGIARTRLFIVDSPVYNGLATGMHIGRAAIMLTSATLKLSLPSIEAILAHEAVHIKKRDVLSQQLARLAFIGGVGGLVYLFYADLQWLAQNHAWVIFGMVYLMIVFYPAYISFWAQWMEVRADHLGALLLSGGRTQMAEGLTALARAQEGDIEKSLEYSLPNQRSTGRSSSILERDAWFWRFLEFQFQHHPPMYWRIQSLLHCETWRKARRLWMIDRFKESVTR